MCLEREPWWCRIRDSAEAVIGGGLRELRAYGDVAVVGKFRGFPGGEAVGVAERGAGGRLECGGRGGVGGRRGHRGEEAEVVELFAGVVLVLVVEERVSWGEERKG